MVLLNTSLLPVEEEAALGLLEAVEQVVLEQVQDFLFQKAPLMR
jgi:hypothetical protein